jgi:hypothetical protein
MSIVEAIQPFLQTLERMGVRHQTCWSRRNATPVDTCGAGWVEPIASNLELVDIIERRPT